ncbi:MAG: tetratricopeptide repeat protein [Vicinamibacterales bacterium]
MRKDSVVFAVTGIFFGLLIGWIVGSQQGGGTPAAPAPVATAAAAPAQAAPTLDENRASSLRATAEGNPRDADSRVQLGNLYFDAERFPDAVKWYEEASKLSPQDVNISTDLGISYYYTNQPDRALTQFERSLAIDPRHSKTLLNVGIVRAFGKQDLDGAAKAFQQVLDVAPGSSEARAARQALDGIRSAHPDPPGGAAKPPGASE